ncbi:MAG: UDP-N-acetylglucosamine--N-acetylmuramyl-(pentapeptide) pyrophosphoryl-undecaprenol N-acetylglucosamine transferase [Clostridia bacterium]|nr:UDP-N-acetylglucosamine--N-acetylmuramyl-(pentapeptide) pyrophosphoryl-undecaprenol N-acetylglucosamine transferase [Clostridia bacterium]
MRILLSGGGTAGHINPAIAIANRIKADCPDSVVAFVGTKNGMENRLVAKAGYDMYHVEVRGLQRSLSPRNILTAYYFLTAPRKAAKLLSEFRPDCVVGTGGYVCWPLLRSASSLGIPCFLHEANAIPGKAVKMLEDKVDRIYINFENSKSRYKHPEKLMYTGNPLINAGGEKLPSRSEARRALGIPDEYRYVVLSSGGSLGATTLTSAVIGMMCEMSPRDDIYVIHSTGRGHFEDAKKTFDKCALDKNFVLRDYIYDMPLWQAAADVIISRSGSMSLSEIARAGKPSVLVPSPYVAENHQFENAKMLMQAGAAEVIEEKELTSSLLCEIVLSLLDDEKKRRRMSEKLRGFSKDDAAEIITKDIIKTINGKKSE